jgi:hypothetical protein
LVEGYVGREVNWMDSTARKEGESVESDFDRFVTLGGA